VTQTGKLTVTGCKFPVLPGDVFGSMSSVSFIFPEKLIFLNMSELYSFKQIIPKFLLSITI
jgi:hypothetical protein